jgi:hypothetical protein
MNNATTELIYLPNLPQLTDSQPKGKKKPKKTAKSIAPAAID